MKYRIIFEVNLSALAPSVKEVENILNASLFQFNVPSVIQLKTDLPIIVTTPHPLEQDGLNRITQSILEVLNSPSHDLSAVYKKTETA